MRGCLLLITAITLTLAAGCSPVDQEGTETPIQRDESPMKITSPDFTDGQSIPSRFTCDGEDVNPKLEIKDVPKTAKSLALVVDDPDAPMGTWTHWILVDIPANTKVIPQDSLIGRQIKNSFKREDWGGPCPPSGTHRYYFKLYALDTPEISATDEKMARKEIEQHKVAEATLLGVYKRI